MSAPLEFRFSRDTDLLSGQDLVRVEYRREGVRRWSKFLVVLDDETTYETVEENAEAIAVYHENMR